MASCGRRRGISVLRGPCRRLIMYYSILSICRVSLEGSGPRSAWDQDVKRDQGLLGCSTTFLEYVHNILVWPSATTSYGYPFRRDDHFVNATGLTMPSPRLPKRRPNSIETCSGWIGPPVGREQAAVAGCGGGGHGGALPDHGVPTAALALPERDVRAVSAVLRGGVCYPGVPHHCIPSFRLEEGTSTCNRVGKGTSNNMEEDTSA